MHLILIASFLYNSSYKPELEVRLNIKELFFIVNVEGWCLTLLLEHSFKMDECFCKCVQNMLGYTSVKGTSHFVDAVEASYGAVSTWA